MPPKVLIVEDEPELLQALRVRFAASGFACETAINGKEGLAVLRRSRPDLIIADLLMPEMDGYEFCRRVQDDQRTASIPIIALSAVPQAALDRRAEPLQATRVLHKPFDSHELIAVARELVAPGSPGGTGHG